MLADRWQGKRFGGTNDVVVKRDGSIYFTDTYGGLRLREKDRKKELDFNAVYMLRGDKLSLLINDIPNTNGLAFSPDEKFLYVNGSRDRFLKRYEVAADGTLKNGTMLIDMNKDPLPGITDGLRVDTRGNIWETGPGGCLGGVTEGEASRHNSHAGAGCQCRVRRCRPQDALHRGAHQHLQDPGERGGNAVTTPVAKAARAREIGLGIIGSGRIGTLRARLAAGHSAVNFIAVSDLDPANAEKLAEQVGGRSHGDDNRRSSRIPR